MKIRTTDRAEVHTVETLGRTQERTPEGYLLCRDVPIGRAGVLLYTPNEISETVFDAEGNVIGSKSIEPGRDGIIRAERSSEENFRPATIASFLGKSVTMGHPDDWVGPSNWQEVTVGVILAVRPGEPPFADCLLADLLITAASAIEAILARNDDALTKQFEVSCGYEANYQQLEPGRARQFNIIGNHTALVDSGRCGSRCAIGDSAMTTKPSWKDRIVAAFHLRDQTALDAVLGEVDGAAAGAPGTHVHVHVAGAQTRDAEGEGAVDDKDGKEKKDGATEDEAPAWFTAHAKSIDERFATMDAAIRSLAGGTTDAASEEGKDEPGEGGREKEGEGDKTKDARTTDSADLQDAFSDMLSRGEILAPGIKLGTFDGKADRVQTLDRMCAFRRRALVAAQAGDNSEVIETLLGKDADISKMTCDGVATSFIAASELVKRSNDAASIGFVHDETRGVPKPASIPDINQKNAAFWASKS